MSTGDKWLGEVAQRMKEEMEGGNAPGPERLTVRELIGKYGYVVRKGYVNSRIQNRLEELNLRSVPDFAIVWAGTTVSIELDPEFNGVFPDSNRPDPTHRIDSLGAAHNKPMSVHSNDPLITATTVMQLHGYSQLPVTDTPDTPRTVRGIISWQSIGTRLVLGRDCQTVSDCMEPAREISKDATLLEAVSIIAEHGYVLVRDRQAGNIISGIVTVSDLGEQFAQLAGPFLLVGEIEGHLKNLIHRKFTLAELRGQSNADGPGKEINGTADLTLGEYCRLLQNPGNWERLNLKIDRGVFSEHLDTVREIRNNIMHFNPDGIDDEDIRVLRDVARFFEDLVRIGAM